MPLTINNRFSFLFLLPSSIPSSCLTPKGKTSSYALRVDCGKPIQAVSEENEIIETEQVPTEAAMGAPAVPQPTQAALEATEQVPVDAALGEPAVSKSTQAVSEESETLKTVQVFAEAVASEPAVSKPTQAALESTLLAPMSSVSNEATWRLLCRLPTKQLQSNFFPLLSTSLFFLLSPCRIVCFVSSLWARFKFSYQSVFPGIFELFVMANQQGPARRNGIIGFQMAGGPTPVIPLVSPPYKGPIPAPPRGNGPVGVRMPPAPASAIPYLSNQGPPHGITPLVGPDTAHSSCAIPLVVPAYRGPIPVPRGNGPAGRPMVPIPLPQFQISTRVPRTGSPPWRAPT
ncbi:unnamed protein product [Penicillium nalgiovense]|nr:unnamed protein product [Penicillium nalgiovense]